MMFSSGADAGVDSLLHSHQLKCYKRERVVQKRDGGPSTSSTSSGKKKKSHSRKPKMRTVALCGAATGGAAQAMGEVQLYIIGETSKKQRAEQAAAAAEKQQNNSRRGGSAIFSKSGAGKKEGGTHEIKQVHSLVKVTSMTATSESSTELTIDFRGSGYLSFIFESEAQRDIFHASVKKYSREALAVRGMSAAASPGSTDPLGLDGKDNVPALGGGANGAVLGAEEEGRLLSSIDTFKCSLSTMVEFEALLSEKIHAKELAVATQLVEDSDSWDTMKSQVDSLKQHLALLEDRVGQYASELVERRVIIEAIEHKNNARKRSRENVTKVCGAMVELQDRITLPNGTVKLIDGLSNTQDQDLMRARLTENMPDLVDAIQQVEAVLGQPSASWETVESPVPAVTEQKIAFLQYRQQVANKVKRYIWGLCDRERTVSAQDTKRKSSKDLLVWKPPTALCAELITAAPIVRSLKQCDSEGYQALIRTVCASLQPVYAREIRCFFKEIKGHVLRHGWRGDRLLGSATDNPGCAMHFDNMVLNGELERGSSVPGEGRSQSNLGVLRFGGGSQATATAPPGSGSLTYRSASRSGAGGEGPPGFRTPNAAGGPSPYSQSMRPPAGGGGGGNPLDRLRTQNPFDRSSPMPQAPPARVNSRLDRLGQMNGSTRGGDLGHGLPLSQPQQPGYRRPSDAGSDRSTSSGVTLLHHGLKLELPDLNQCGVTLTLDHPSLYLNDRFKKESDLVDDEDTASKASRLATLAAARVLGVEGSGSVRPDIAFSIALGSAVDIILYQEALLVDGLQVDRVAPSKNGTFAPLQSYLTELFSPPDKALEFHSAKDLRRRRGGGAVSWLDEDSDEEEERLEAENKKRAAQAKREGKTFVRKVEEDIKCITKSLIEEELVTFTKLISKECDRVYVLSMLDMVDAVHATESASNSAFLLPILHEMKEELTDQLVKYLVDQSTSIQRCALKAVKTNTFLSFFSNFPLFIQRVESMQAILTTPTQPRFHLLLGDITQQMFDTLDELSYLGVGGGGSGGSGFSGGRGYNTGRSSKQSAQMERLVAECGKPDHHNIKKGYLMQYRHCAFFMVAAANCGPETQKFLAGWVAECTKRRDRYGHLYLHRLILAEELPQFAQFTTAAEDLNKAYEISELSYHRAVNRESFATLFKVLESELQKGLPSAGQRIRRHLTAGIPTNSLEEGFHQKLLQATWFEFKKIVQGKIDFLCALPVKLKYEESCPVDSARLKTWFTKAEASL